MAESRTILITGTSRGIGRYLAEHYIAQDECVVGCSRGESDLEHPRYEHFCVDVANEAAVVQLFAQVRKKYPGLNVLINNAGVAPMNHALLTPMKTVEAVFGTNFSGTFLFCREAAKLMQRSGGGRIVNFSTLAVPLKLEGEAVYAASKAAVVSLTEILAREFAPLKVTVNAVGPTPIKTEMIETFPKEKVDRLLARQAIPRFGEFRDISNVIDFLIRPESEFVTGQTIYLGGV